MISNLTLVTLLMSLTSVYILLGISDVYTRMQAMVTPGSPIYQDPGLDRS